MGFRDYQQLEQSEKRRFDSIAPRNFLGRPDIDRNDTSDSEMQLQREGQPYDRRMFRPRQKRIVNDEVKTLNLHAGGNVEESELPFTSVQMEETLDDGTRRRCFVVREDGGAELFKVCSDGEMEVCGQDLKALLGI